MFSPNDIDADLAKLFLAIQTMAPERLKSFQEALGIQGLYQRRLPQLLTGLGDSRVAAFYADPQGTNRSSVSPVNWANDMLGQRVAIGPAFGKSGDRTDQFIARLPQVLATRAGILYLQGGVNDHGQAFNGFDHAVTGERITLANSGLTAANNMIYCCETARKAGMIVIAELEIGSNGLIASQIQQVNIQNQVFMDYADLTPDIYVNDARLAVTDVTFSETVIRLLADSSEDGTHLNARGSWRHARGGLMQLIDRVVPQNRQNITARSRSVNPQSGRTQLFRNPFFLGTPATASGTGVSGTTPPNTNTSVVSTAGTLLATTVAANPSGPGNIVTMDCDFRAAGDQCRFNPQVNIGDWSPGDIFEAVMELSVSTPGVIQVCQLECGPNGTDAAGTQVGRTPVTMVRGVPGLGPNEPYDLTLRTRPSQISPAMVNKGFMAVALRVFSNAVGQGQVKVKSFTVNRKTSLQY